MTTFDRWYEAQQEHLKSEVWLELFLRVARLDALIGNESFVAAEHALSATYQAINRHNVPAWHIFVELMESSLSLSYRGNLGHALDLAMHAVVAVEQLPDESNQPLRMAAWLQAMRSWLKTDEVGHAPRVLRTLESILPDMQDSEWRYWYQVTRAWALSALGKQADARQILAEVQAHMPSFADEADRLEGHAYIQYRMGHSLRAAEMYKEAASSFSDSSLHFSAARCQLNHILCLYEGGNTEESAANLPPVLRDVERLGAPHYIGLAHCLWGRNALAMNEPEEALDHLEQAFDLYDGRGWLRDEAQIAVEYVEALANLGESDGERWNDAVEIAFNRISNLPSKDLQERLNRVLEESDT